MSAVTSVVDEVPSSTSSTSIGLQAQGSGEESSSQGSNKSDNSGLNLSGVRDRVGMIHPKAASWLMHLLSARVSFVNLLSRMVLREEHESEHETRQTSQTRTGEGSGSERVIIGNILLLS